ncbi:MAG: hypothetical protein AVDCRST_MAG87-706, partial [uncultured Thermomicrobiales bacterium]
AGPTPAAALRASAGDAAAGIPHRGVYSSRCAPLPLTGQAL